MHPRTRIIAILAAVGASSGLAAHLWRPGSAPQQSIAVVAPQPAAPAPAVEAAPFVLIAGGGEVHTDALAGVADAERWRTVTIAEGASSAAAWQVGMKLRFAPFADRAYDLTVRAIDGDGHVRVIHADDRSGMTLAIILRDGGIALRAERPGDPFRLLVAPRDGRHVAIEVDRLGEQARWRREAGQLAAAHGPEHEEEAAPATAAPRAPAAQIAALPAPAPPIPAAAPAIAGPPAPQPAANQPPVVAGPPAPPRQPPTFGGPGFDPADLPPSQLRDDYFKQTPAQRAQALAILRGKRYPAADVTELRIFGGQVAYVCRMEEPAGITTAAASGPIATDPVAMATSVPISSPPAYHSKSGSSRVLFLDFNGGTISNSHWQLSGSFPSVDYVCYPWSMDADRTTFSDTEQAVIYAIWQRVAEDYAPFDIDVTTVQPSSWTSTTGHVMITPQTDQNGTALPHSGAGTAGIAWQSTHGPFGFSNYSYNYGNDCLSPCWAKEYQSTAYVQFMAMCCAHEFGHNLGLSHDGTSTSAYYGGHGSGATSWCPIMGSSSSCWVDQFSKGEYYDANNTEDDLAIIDVNLPYRSDDHGDTIATADSVSYGSGCTSFTASGRIGAAGDIDAFKFQAGSGAISITVSPLDCGYQGGGDLDAKLELYNAAGSLVASSDPTGTITATLNYTSPSSQVYTVMVEQSSCGTPLVSPPSGYTTYDSLGQYSLAGTMPAFPAEIDITGNGHGIASGDTMPSSTDGTDFGAMTPGTQVINSFFIDNTGGADLTGVSISLSGSSCFNFAGLPAGSTVPGQSSAEFDVRYTAGAGTATTTVTVLSSDSNEGTYTFTLSGTGTTSLSYGATAWAENASDNGGFSSTIAVTLSNDSFTGSNGNDLIALGRATVTGLPAGLTMVATRTSSTGLTLSLTGTATNNAYANSTTCTLTFLDSAFALGTASGHTNYSQVFNINFNTPQEIELRGNGQIIVSGDVTPSTSDNTDYGTMVGGNNLTRTFTINNLGGSNLTPVAVALSGSGASAFSVTTSPATTVAGFGSTTFNLKGTAGVGTSTATVTVTSNDADEASSTFAVKIVGTSTLAWGSTALSESVSNDNGSIPGTIALTLSGDTFAGAIGGDLAASGAVSATGLPAGLTLKVVKNSTTSATLSLTGSATAHAAANSTSVTVTFANAAFTAANASGHTGFSQAVALTFNDPPEIQISGNSTVITAGDATPSAADDTDFGSLVAGTVVAHAFTIANVGQATLSGITAALSGPGASAFSITTSPAASVLGGQSTTLVVQGTAPIGTAAATVTVTSNDADEGSSTFAIQIVGSAAVTYGASGFSESSADDGTFPGSITATLTSDTFNGADGDDFIATGLATVSGVPAGLTVSVTRTSATGLSIAVSGTAASSGPTDSTSFTLNLLDAAFAAGQAANHIGGSKSLALTMNTAAEIEILGKGVVIAAGDATPSAADDTDFGTVAAGTVVARTFTVDNLGGSLLTPVGVSVSGSNAFAITAAPATTVAGNGSTTFVVTATAPVGAATATVTVTSNDSDEASSTFAVAIAGTSSLAYSASDFAEASADNGTYPGSVTATLTSDTFAGAGGQDLVALGLATATNLPAGLTAVATRTSATTVAITLSGTAAASSWTDGSSFTLAFADGAFTGGNAGGHTGSSKLFTVTPNAAPDIEIRGKGQVIVAGDATPSTTDDTDFGSAIAGTQVAHTFTVSNLGPSILQPISVAISGTGAASFAVTTAPANFVADGGSTTFVITGTAPVGTATATVTVSSNDPDEGSSSFAVTMSGTAGLSWSGGSLSEDTTTAGAIAGSVTVTLGGDTFTGANGSDLSGQMTVSGVPAGLTLVATRTSSTTVAITFSGTATSNDYDQGVTVSVAFTDGAFATGNAAGHANDSSSIALIFDGLTVTTALDSGSDATTGASLAADRADGGGLSLREAIAWASGRTITFALGTATITLGGAELAIANSMTIDGGGLITVDAASLSRVFNCTSTTATVTITNLTATHGWVGGSANSTTYDGAGIKTVGNLNLSGVTISGCSASSTATTGSKVRGAGLNLGGLNKTFVITDCTITGNSGTSTDASGAAPDVQGGGVALASGTATVTRCTISSNTASDSIQGARGGGFYVLGSSILTLIDSTISGNTSTGEGGGLELLTSTVTLKGCTVSGNRSTQSDGGGISNEFATLSVYNSTFANNSCSSGFGNAVILWNSTSCSFVSTIVAANPSVGSAGNDVDAGSTSGTMTLANCLYTASRVADNGGGNVTITSSVNATNPKLAALGDNGGTTLTHALQAGSPALNAGANPLALTGDQRGYTRVVGAAIDIGALEDQPVTITSAKPASASMSEDGSPTAWTAPTITASDPDLTIGTGALTWSILSQASHGTASITGGAIGTPSYVPNANYNGSDSFVVQVSDGTNTDSVTVDVTIGAVNDAPVITGVKPRPLAATEDTPASLSLSATDVDGDSLGWSISSQGALGVAGVDGSGGVTYTPNANANGSDSFVVQVSDGHGGSDTVTVQVTIAAVNDPPVCTVLPTFSGGMKAGQLLTAATGTWNDSADSGTIASYAYQWQRADDASGTNLTAIVGATSSTYTIGTGLVGKWIRAAVTATDGGGATATAVSAWAQVLDSDPVITPGAGAATSTTVDEDTSFTMSFTAADADGDTITWSTSGGASLYASVPAAPTTGGATTVTFTPIADANGSDTVVITAADGHGGTASYSVSVTLTAVNDPPVDTAAPTVSGTGATGQTLTGTDGTWNDAKDGGTIAGYAYQWQRADDAGGTNAVDIGGATAITYLVAGADAGHWVRLAVTATDAGGASTTACSPWLAIADTAPVITQGASASVSMSEDGSPTAFALTLDATDADGQTLTWSIASQGTLGVAAASGTGASKAIAYTPNADANGSDSFVVQVSDGFGGTASCTVNVAIAAVNDAPVIAQGASVLVTMSEDASPTAFALTLDASDVEGDTLTWSISAAAGHGTASVSGTGASKAIAYTPSADYNGSDSFTVQVDDGNGGVATTVISVMVQAVNDPPVCTVAPSITGSAQVGQLLTGASGTWNDAVDGGTPISYAYQWQRADDGVGLNAADIGGATGQNRTIAVADAHHWLRLVVTATDSGTPGAASAIAMTGWLAVLDSDPAITQGAAVPVTMSEDGSPTAFALTLDATDADADALAWSIAAVASHGTASVSGTGASKAIAYAPSADYNGSDSFTVQVDDGHGGVASTVISVTVDAVNDAPVCTVAPSISGTPAVTQTLTAVDGSWNDAKDGGGTTIAFSRQWQIADDGAGTGAADIGGATGSTYLVVAADNLKWVRVVVTATDDGAPGTASATANSAWTQIGNTAPVITEGATASVSMSEDASPTAFALTLHATDVDGNTLTWSIGTAAGKGTASVSGTGGAKAIAYAPDADANGSDSFVVTVQDGNGGSASCTVDVTIAAVNDPPVNTAPPTVSGAFLVGQTLTVADGSWNDLKDGGTSTIAYARKWQRADDAFGTNAADIAVGPSYLLLPGDYAHFVRAVVTATDNGAPGSASASASTAWTAVAQSAPTVAAGANQTVTLPATASLSGTVADDGAPGPTTVTWSLVSGPGTVSFVDATAVATSASFSTWGTYVLRLTADDGALSAHADVTITVHGADANGLAPVITPATVTVHGTVTAGTASVTVGGVAATIDGAGNFTVQIPMPLAATAYTLTATDSAGHATTRTITITPTGPGG